MQLIRASFALITHYPENRYWSPSAEKVLFCVCLFVCLLIFIIIFFFSCRCFTRPGAGKGGLTNCYFPVWCCKKTPGHQEAWSRQDLTTCTRSLFSIQFRLFFVVSWITFTKVIQIYSRFWDVDLVKPKSGAPLFFNCWNLFIFIVITEKKGK